MCLVLYFDSWWNQIDLVINIQRFVVSKLHDIYDRTIDVTRKYNYITHSYTCGCENNIVGFTNQNQKVLKSWKYFSKCQSHLLIVKQWQRFPYTFVKHIALFLWRDNYDYDTYTLIERIHVYIYLVNYNKYKIEEQNI